jgi:NitT/TauT family transport system substrate-binding protein
LFTDDGVKAINNMAIEAGLITEPVDRSALINETFVKKAAGQK